LHIAVLRSTQAHALLRNIDATSAIALPGVVAVFTGAELAESAGKFQHHLAAIPTLRQIEWDVLAIEKVKYVGEPIAAVVAESRYVAEDALDLIEVDYDELPAVVDVEAALAPGAPLLYEDWTDNLLLQMPGAHGDVDAAFSEADGVIRARFHNHRISGMPLEGHGAVAEFDASTGRLVLRASTQAPHMLRGTIAQITGLSEAQIQVIAPDTGGGFGVKNHAMREEALAAVIAMRVPHPVVWEQDRVEHLTAGIQSREQIHDAELAYRSDGRVLGLRARITADIGSPELYIIGAAPAVVTTGVMPNTYDIPNYGFELNCVVTNKCPIGGYRGYGQPQAIFTIERLMDMLAAELEMDPAEIRKLNNVADDAMPYTTATGANLDTGSFNQQLDHLLEAIDYSTLREQVEAERASGALVGLGIAQMVEPTAPNMHALAGQFGCYEMALFTVHPDGHVSLSVGTKSQGQGHETIYAKLAAEVLTIPIEHVEVYDGDTNLVPFGGGTSGSRSAVMGGGVVLKAARQARAKMIEIAAAMLGVSGEDIELRDGMFFAGEAVLPLAAVAGAAYLHTFLLPPGMDPGISMVVAYDPGNTSPFPDETGKLDVAATYATAAAAAVVSINPNTGVVTVRDLTLVHDCGNIIDETILNGQIQGAIAQAIGATFYEEIHYSDEGQPLTTTLLDYMIPACGDFPEPRLIHRETPSELIGGFRGAGEGAIIVTPPALANAVADALGHLDNAAVTQTNLGPRHIREILRANGVALDPLAGRSA
jgi:carbon-monoxide dehydrogenase large subunit